MPVNNRIPENMQRVEELIGRIEAAADPNTRIAAVELVQVLMDLHGDGIARMLQIASQAGAPGAEVVRQYSRDDLVGQLLMLYNLHPVDLQTRVKTALEKVRPTLKSHDGDVELLGINDGVVHLRLEGNCDGCPSSSQTLKNLIEEAIYEAASDVAGLEVEGLVSQPPPPSGFIPLEAMTLS